LASHLIKKFGQVDTWSWTHHATQVESSKWVRVSVSRLQRDILPWVKTRASQLGVAEYVNSERRELKVRWTVNQLVWKP
jgi:hypothetical protein